MKEYLTAKQVAEILKLHPKTVYRYIREGYLPAVKMRRIVRISQEDVEKFINKEKVSKKSKPKNLPIENR